MILSTLLPVSPSANPIWFRQSVDSTLSQALPEGWEHELLIYWDGHDGLPIPDDRRITTLSSNKQGGVARALNGLLAIANGTYVARIDADDYSLPGRYLAQIQRLSHGIEDVLGTGLRTEQSVHIEPNIIVHEHAIKALTALAVPCFHPTYMVRREVYKKHLYQSEFDHAEDYAWSVQVHNHGWKFGNLREPYVEYRQHQNQASRVHAEQQRASAGRARGGLIR